MDAAGAYLVTGGLGGLGLRFAQWLFERGARHVVLVGRRPPSTAADAIVTQLRERGATITVRGMDVADAAAVEALIAEFGASLPPLRGVIHAAGHLDNATLLEQDWKRFESVFAAKVAGAWNLHLATRNLALEFFVLFSSAVAIFGNSGQANHAAANAFLDQLAHVRRAQGLQALSMNWGAWGEIGAAAGNAVAEHIARRGFESFSPAEGVQSAELTMRSGVPQRVVVAADWAALDKSRPAWPLIAELAAETVVPVAERAAPDMRKLLESVPAEQRSALLLEQVRTEVARVIGAEDAGSIDAERGFFTLGLDSLTSVELRNRLQRGLRVELPSTVAFDYPTLLSLTGFLRREALAELFNGAPAAARETSPAGPTEVAAAEVSASEGDEVAIARELAELQAVLARNR
jgi:NAD(P)-dependent dehydrogenase (short-subunit alcohol dehydrogenase family)/acyl carrier protein